jgi:hypothetical protein
MPNPVNQKLLTYEIKNGFIPQLSYLGEFER